MLRSLILALGLASAAALGPMATAQDAPPALADDPAAVAADIETRGTGRTLEDILARQNGQRGLDTDPDSVVERAGRGDPADPDAEIYRELRQPDGDVTVTAAGPATKVLIQEGGVPWLAFRDGPLVGWGSALLLGMAVLLAAFYLIVGRVPVKGRRTGRVVRRFNILERTAHWVLAGSFILLSLTGLVTLVGRRLLIPVLGHEAYAALAQGCKWVRNNVAWAFTASLLVVFALWVAQNLPRRGDLAWMMSMGGMLGGPHVPARKFNAGQKAIFWSVIALGGSISASGLSLLVPVELPMFAKTFGLIDATGIPGPLGLDMPVALAPQEEMQYAQAWHAIVSYVLMAIALAHIYIGPIGMEGAYRAMGRGRVDEAWAREHHELWYDEVRSRRPEAIEPEDGPRDARGPAATPAE